MTSKQKYYHQYYLRNKSRIIHRTTEYAKSHREQRLAIFRAGRERLKLAVLSFYGPQNQPICSCCRESKIAFLGLDHIAGGGSRHRKEIFGQRGGSLYQWVKRSKFPLGMFQVLCHNCNLGRHINKGICPHKDCEEMTNNE